MQGVVIELSSMQPSAARCHKQVGRALDFAFSRHRRVTVARDARCMQELMASRVPAASPPKPHAHVLRVVHQLPERVRLRPCAGRWTRRQKECVAAALRRTSGVQAFRISDHSLVVEHSAPLPVVIETVAIAAQEPVPSTQVRAVRHAPGSRSGRSARRRLLACAVVTLAIALLPEPAAPAMIALRLVAGAITAMVRHHAESQARPGALTRILEAIEFLVGLARADNLLRALCKHCAQAVLKRWAEGTLRPARA